MDSILTDDDKRDVCAGNYKGPHEFVAMGETDESMEDYYKVRLRHLETPEFIRWFETWNCQQSEIEGAWPGLLAHYLHERNFALMGWIAAKADHAETMSRIEFIHKVAPLYPAKNPAN